jgi:hypothetical protein
LGAGTLLKRGDGASPEVFTTIPEIFSITGPSGATDLKDATHMQSVAKEYILGLPDFGEYAVEMNWIVNNTVQEGLRSDFINRVTRNFKLEDHGASPAEVWTIVGLVTGFSLAFPADDKVVATVTIKITGAPTIV